MGDYTRTIQFADQSSNAALDPVGLNQSDDRCGRTGLLSAFCRLLGAAAITIWFTAAAYADIGHFVKRWEGFSAIAYQDDGRVWTIGYGTTNASPCLSFHLRPDSIVDEAQADQFLHCHLELVRSEVRRLVRPDLPDAAEDALVSFSYNIGLAAFADSTLLRKLNAGDIDGAAAQFDRWIYCDGKVLRGLVRRRAAEKRLFLSAF